MLGRHAAPKLVNHFKLDGQCCRRRGDFPRHASCKARKVKRWDSASPHRITAVPCNQTQAGIPAKGENTEQLDSLLLERQNALNKECRTLSGYFLTVSFSVRLLGWICPLIMPRRRSTESMWPAGLSMEDAGRLASIPARLVPRLVLFFFFFFYKRKRSVMVITGITRGTRSEASEKGTVCPQRWPPGTKMLWVLRMWAGGGWWWAP